MKNIRIKKEGNSSLIGVFVPVGSRDESNNIKGISHFVEHMLFKGTTNRSKDDIKREIEQYGAYFNAWTSEEHTFYYVKISNKYLDVARNVIHDMVQNPLFPHDETEKEREVILQELDMYHDNPQTAVFEMTNKLIYPENSGLHLPIIGTKDTLKYLNAEKLKKFHSEQYKEPIILEVGAVEEARNQYLLPKPYVPELHTGNLKQYRCSRKGINQANMVYTGTFNVGDKFNDFDMHLLACIMNGFTGRLFDTIREKNNMVYHVALYSQSFRGGNMQYWVYAGLTSERIEEANKLIVSELTRPVTKDEVDFAVRKFIGDRELDLDNDNFIAKTIIDSTMEGKNYEDELLNYEAKINEVKERANDFIEHINFKKGKVVALIPDNE